MVLYALGTQHLAHDEVGDGAHAHITPSFIVVVVLARHQLVCLCGDLVVQSRGLFYGQVGLVDHTELQLDNTHRRIVDNADELRLDAFIHKLFRGCLQRPDSLYFDKNLIRNGRCAQDAPGRTVVLHLVDKQFAALRQYAMKLGFCIFLLHEKCIFAKIKLFSMLRINSRNKTLIFDRPALMGILNVTPDSFSDGGRYNQMDKALQHCEQMIADGADFIDIGGYSTRPNNAIATEQEELERVVPILKAIRTAFPEVLISIDTFRKNIAEACMNEGADLINDISGGLFDAEMLPYIGKNHIPYVMMHCVGTPETMHQYTLGGDIHQIVMDFFKQQCTILEAYGEQQIILDPGIGFGKSIEANYQLLGDLERYRYNGLPVLIGISRKSLIFKVLGTTPQAAENGTTILNTIALLHGADILRVHDVKNAREAIELVGTFCNFAPKFNL